MKDCSLYITNGKIENTPQVRRFFEGLSDGKYLLEAKNINHRTLPQNKYYWSCVVPMVREGLRDAGYNDIETPEDTHEVIKAIFLKKTISNGIDEIPIVGSTAKLTKEEFTDFIEKIAQWCSEYLLFALPMPNQQMEFTYA